MSKPIYKKLIITAFITSLAFGAFSALIFYLVKQLNQGQQHEIVLNPPPRAPRFHPAEPPLRAADSSILNRRQERIRAYNLHAGYLVNSNSFIVSRSLFVMGGMFAIWLLNIGILFFFGKAAGRSRARVMFRIAVSYIVILLLAIVFVYANWVERSSPRAYLSGSPAETVRPVPARPVATFQAKGEEVPLPVMTAVVLHTIVIVILELLLVQDRKAQVQLENAQLKMNQWQAKHQHLKDQLHPHFLFNSLSTLKSLIRLSPAKAEEYLLRLSEFLRSSLSKNELSVVSLGEELRLCIDYLDMQQMRFGDAFRYTIQIPDNVIADSSLPAFSLQVLVENAIKHNILTVESPLQIDIGYEAGGYIEVKNNKQIRVARESSPAIGLKNLSERYKMLSGDEVQVITSDSDFVVKIKALKA